MKSIMIALALVATNSAFALSASDSWSTIQSSRNVAIVAPTVAFATGGTTTYVPVTEVCVLDETHFQTINPVNIWSVSYNGHSAVETVVGAEKSIASNKYQTMVYNGSKVGHYEERTIGTTHNLDVMFKIVGSNSSAQKLFSKSFTIPSCSTTAAPAPAAE